MHRTALLLFTLTATWMESAWCQEYPATFVQMGEKLVGTGAVGPACQGTVAVSADGSTAIVGGYADNGHMGAAWVFTRSGGVWTQQGNKLVGIGVVGVAEQGMSVAMSADGNTAAVGGIADNNGTGAVWVFTRSGGVWSQQGSKLVGTGAESSALSYQGNSVALSADGNTVAVGGLDNWSAALWVFTRSGGVWTQQGTKLVGSGSVGNAEGVSVALSADGSTALLGAQGDNNGIGAAWVFTCSAGVWTQQGNKLVGSDAAGQAFQGSAMALSADGNTALIGGPLDNSFTGAVWVFTRSGGVWTQQGSKLRGTGAIGAANQGGSVALSADGNTALVGGGTDNNAAGAAWLFTRTGGVWSQKGRKLVGTGASGAAQQGSSVALSGDGTVALLGGHADNGYIGATWAFIGTSMLTLSPKTVSLSAGQTRQFTSTTIPAGGWVTYALSAPASGGCAAPLGTVGLGGLYRAPASIKNTCNVTLTATFATRDATRTDTATITLLADTGGYLHVHVTNAQTKQPIAGATVQLTGQTNYTAPTDGSGMASFGPIPQGLYWVIVTAPSYKLKVAFATVSNGATQDVNVPLAP